MTAFWKTADLTWTCHVCGERRPDKQISVFVRRHDEFMQENIRYCNDREKCRAGAKTKCFFGGTHDDSTGREAGADKERSTNSYPCLLPDNLGT